MSSNIFLPLSTMFMSTILSLYYTFDTKIDEADFFPNTLDKTFKNKVILYLSRFTYSNSLFLLFYFLMKLFNYDCNLYFITLAPISFSVNINYFIILYPKKNIKLYQLSYHSFVQHFMTTFIVLNELPYIHYDSIYDIFYYNYFIIYGVIITLINYNVRNIWTYTIINLYSFRGWFLFLQFNIICILSSNLLYILNKNLL